MNHLTFCIVVGSSFLAGVPVGMFMMIWLLGRNDAKMRTAAHENRRVREQIAKGIEP